MADKESIKNKAVNVFLDFFTEKVVVEPEGSTAQSANKEAETQEAERIVKGAVPISDSGVVDPSIKEKLWEEIYKNDIDGIDFLEFSKMLDANDSVRTVDKYNSVFTMLQALTKDKSDLKKILLETGKSYVDVLAKEKLSFEASFEELVDERIGSKQSQLEEAGKQVAELELQLKNIQGIIHDKKNLMAELEDGISTEGIELRRQKSNFLATVTEVTSEIEEKLANIATYIKDVEVSK